MAKSKAVSEALKQAIARSGLSYYEIAKQTGVQRSALTRFMSGERGLTLESTDAICLLLRLELRKGKR